MFEYAISQHRKHPPSRRFFASTALSCVLHVLTLFLLIEYPQLLSPGRNPWFRQPAILTALFSRDLGAQKEADSWRTVTFVGKTAGNKMVAPSAETLRKYLYDWSKQKGGTPTVRVRWGNEKEAGTADTAVPRAKPVPGLQEPKPVGVAEAAMAPPAAGGEGAPQVAQADSGSGRGTVYLPPPQPDARTARRPETSQNVAPTSVPSGITQPEPSQPAPAPKPASPAATKPGTQIFQDEQKAIRTEGSGLFDTRGFPLGDYANLVIERVRGNWLIPSNLRNSQGRTTVIFYIDRDGRFTNARIVTSSGSSSLDLAALNAVIGSNPFPPLPKGFPGDHVGAKFVFSYNERQ